MPAPKTAKLPPIPEREVQKQIIAEAALLGVKLHRQNTGAFRVGNRFIRCATKGAADLTGTLFTDGRRCEVEVKRKGKRPSADQIKYLREINDLGGVGLWADDPEQFRHALAKILQGWRVEMDDHGGQVLTDEPREGK